MPKNIFFTCIFALILVINLFYKERKRTIMADNYLEKQREQYEARKAAWEKAKKMGKVKTSSTTSSNPKQTPRATTENETK